MSLTRKLYLNCVIDGVANSFDSKQADMHLCAAKCCEDKNGSIDSVEGCIERCSAPLNRAQKYVQKELGDYQGRLQRCVMVNCHFNIIYIAICISTNYD